MVRLSPYVRRLTLNRRGISAILTALLAPILIGFVGLAVDTASWQIAVNNMQGAADMAAWAAELEYNATSSTDNATTQARGIAASMGFVNDTAGVTVTVNIPPQSGTHTSQSGAVEVVIAQQQDRYLSRLFLDSAPTASARAVVGTSGGTTPTCMASLDSNAADPTNLYIGGSNNTINLAGCAYYNNSTSATAINMTGTSNTFTAKTMTLAGARPTPGGTGNTLCPSPCTLTANVATSGTSPNDPFASQTIPAAGSCTTYPAGKLITKTSFTGGATFCGGFLLSGATVNFSNGIYVFNGSSLSGTNANITVSNATLVFTGSSALGYGSLTLSGTSKLNLTAPTSSSGYSTTGISIWFDKNAGTTKGVVMSATSTTTMAGAIYAPGSSVKLDGTASSTCTDIVAYQITVDGSNDSLTYNSSTCSNSGTSGSGGSGGGGGTVGFLE